MIPWASSCVLTVTCRQQFSLVTNRRVFAFAAQLLSCLKHTKKFINFVMTASIVCADGFADAFSVCRIGVKQAFLICVTQTSARRCPSNTVAYANLEAIVCCLHVTAQYCIILHSDRVYLTPRTSCDLPRYDDWLLRICRWCVEVSRSRTKPRP